jgi:hypothetical protein
MIFCGTGNLPWGMAALPLIVDEKVIVLPGGSGGKSVVAYNRMTGDPIWQNKRMKNKFASSVLHAGFICGLLDAGPDKIRENGSCLVAIWRGVCRSARVGKEHRISQV